MKTYKVEITEEFIKEAHASACDEWKEKIENLVPDAFEVKAGKWYKYNDRVFFITEFDEEGYAHGYGIDSRGNWLDARDVNLDLCILNECLIEFTIQATDKEVEEMLTEEAKRRGLVEGVEVKSLLTSVEKQIIGNYKLINNAFLTDAVGGYVCIFKNGEWAKPIKNETLKRIEALENKLAKLKSEL